MTQPNRTNLNVTVRRDTGKGPNRRLRAAGLVPAVVYSRGKDPVSVIAQPKEVVAHLNGEFGRNGAINLQIEGEKSPRLAIIKEYTVHPWQRSLEHIDFWEITPDTILTLTVPFAGVGKTETEKQGGRVRYTRDDVMVRCKPDDVPAKITYDLSSLPFGPHNITISQIPLPKGVTAHFKNDYSLIQVQLPKVVTDEEAKEGEEGAAPAASA